MNDEIWLAGALSFEEAAELAGVDRLLVTETDHPSSSSWLQGSLEIAAGARTYDSRVRALADRGMRRSALRLAAGARARGVALAPASEEAAKQAIATLRDEAAARRAEAEQALTSVRSEAVESAALAEELRNEMLGLEPDIQPGWDPLAMARWLETLDRMERLAADARALVRASEEEIGARVVRVRDAAIEAVRQLVDVLLGDDETGRGHATRVLGPFAEMVLERRLDALERLRDGQFESVGVATPRRALRTPMLPVPIKPPASATEPRLSPVAQSLLSSSPAVGTPVTSPEVYRAVRDEAARMVLPARRRFLLGHAQITPPGTLRNALLGAGLLAGGVSYLHNDQNARFAQVCLSDALACVVASGANADSRLRDEAVGALVQCCCWPRLSSDQRANDRALSGWPFDLGRLLRWAQHAGELGEIGELWANAHPDSSRELLATLRIHAEDVGALMRAFAGSLLKLPPIARDPEAAFSSLLDLLSGGASPKLASSFHRIAQLLAESDRARVQAAARIAIIRELDLAEAELALMPPSVQAPTEEIHERLPVVIRELIDARAVPEAPRISIKAEVKTIYLGERTKRVRLPVVIRNAEDAAPARELFVRLTIGADDGELLMFRTALEQPVGTIEPGAIREVSYYFDVARDLSEATTVRVAVVAMTGHAQTAKTTVDLALMPQSRASRKSPYQPGVTLEAGEGFVGRERQLKAITDALLSDARRVPAVVGIRRVGKTSLLHAVRRDAAIASSYAATYVSLEDRPDSETSTSFLTFIATKIRDALSSAMSPTNLNDLPFARDTFRNDPYAAFEAFCAAVEAARPARRVLLILDEFDKLMSIVETARTRAAQAGDRLTPDMALQPEVFGALRKMIMSGRTIRVVVAGLPRLTRQSYDERFFGTLEPVHVQGFTDEEARRVIAAGASTMTLSDEAEREVLRTTGAQPYLLQVVCHALFNTMLSEGRDIVTLDDVREVIEREVLPNQTYFRDFLSLLDEPKRRIVRAMAHLHRENSWQRYVSVANLERELGLDNQSRSDLVASLEELRTDDRPLVERAPNHSLRYRLKIGLIGDLLLR